MTNCPAVVSAFSTRVIAIIHLLCLEHTKVPQHVPQLSQSNALQNETYMKVGPTQSGDKLCVAPSAIRELAQPAFLVSMRANPPKYLIPARCFSPDPLRDELSSTRDEMTPCAYTLLVVPVYKFIVRLHPSFLAGTWSNRKNWTLHRTPTRINTYQSPSCLHPRSPAHASPLTLATSA